MKIQVVTEVEVTKAVFREAFGEMTADDVAEALHQILKQAFDFDDQHQVVRTLGTRLRVDRKMAKVLAQVVEEAGA